MPDACWTQSLAAAVDRVLETMFFTVASGPVDAAALDAPGSVGARLTFEGHAAGSLSVRLTSGAARTLAADFLGADPEAVTSAQITEVVCELANMICGSVVSELESQDLIRLSSAISFSGPATSPASAAVAEYAVELPDGALLAIVEVLKKDGANV